MTSMNDPFAGRHRLCTLGGVVTLGTLLLFAGAVGGGCGDGTDTSGLASSGNGAAGGTTSSGGGNGAGGSVSSGTGGEGAAGGSSSGSGGSTSSGTGGGGGGGGWPQACSGCHGSPANPAPPKDTHGNTNTTDVAVGAHQSHIAASSWHNLITCDQCHIVPTVPGNDPNVPTHMNGTDDVIWGPLASADNTNGQFDETAATCTGVYCHGASLLGDKPNVTSNRTPHWTTVDGSQKECGLSCHTTPPGSGHPQTDSCPSCHTAVIASFDPNNPSAAQWVDAKLHIDGIVEVAGGLTCTTCHGDANTSDPAPPLGTNGETLTTQNAVGAHQEHLAASSWHRQVQCEDCHDVPISTSHSNGVTDFGWDLPANADGANPSYNGTSCQSVYCHGTTLFGPKPNGSVNRTPHWTVVNGTYNSCGDTCHTNPPGDTHVTHTDCTICHTSVVASFNPNNNATTWVDASLHVNGTVEVNNYHDLPNWTSPGGNPNHHGTNYFLTNQQRDEHNTPCTQCHGANLDGGSVGVSCNNPNCHGGNWKACTFCHGTPPNQNNPPDGVGGETTIDTLAVGRHMAHLTASNSHVAFACGTCHQVPGAGNVSHAGQYVPTADLSTAGHHGDISFSAPATGMTWDVSATGGNPVNRRGTCVDACHSDGNGGPPNVIPYWAGGTWNSGDCGNCHSDPPNNGKHNKHVNGENIACTVCHDPASSQSHMNGQIDVHTNISGPNGGGVTYDPNGCGNGVPSCTGNCHGKNHGPKCWQ